MFSLLIATSVSAQLSELERLAKLTATPITIYPDFTVAGSALVPVLNRYGRPGDAVAVSQPEVLQADFRVQRLGLRAVSAKLLMHTPTDLRRDYRRQLTGLSGVVVLPPAPRKSWGVGSRPVLVPDIRGLLANIDCTGWDFTAGWPETNLRRLQPQLDLAGRWPVIAIYWPRLMGRGQTAFREELERVTSAVHRQSPQTRFELILPTAASPEGTRQIAQLAFNNIDLVQRLGIVCDRSAPSQTSLLTLLQSLRETP